MNYCTRLIASALGIWVGLKENLLYIYMLYQSRSKTINRAWEKIWVETGFEISRLELDPK